MFKILITTIGVYGGASVSINTSIAEFNTRDEAMMALNRINNRESKDLKGKSLNAYSVAFEQNAIAMNF